MSRVVIIGGGIIGYFSAYYCSLAGHEVTIIDSSPERTDGCSYGNGGMIVPSHYVPLANPAALISGFGNLLGFPEKAISMNTGFAPSRLAWLAQFIRKANEKNVARLSPIIAELNLRSKEEFLQFSEQYSIGLKQSGMLILCQEKLGWKDEQNTYKNAAEFGLKAESFGKADLQILEPDCEIRAAGGMVLEDDACADPDITMNQLRMAITALGVKVVKGEVTGFSRNGENLKAALTQDGQSIEGDEFVLAAGVWSEKLAKEAGTKVPLMPGKGYGFTIRPQPIQIRHCFILHEARAAISSLSYGLRCVGCMEIGGKLGSVHRARVDYLQKGITLVLPGVTKALMKGIPIWQGLRPLSPDGAPYIGRTRGAGNLTIAAGHAMMGFSLGPITGKLVSQIVGGEKPEMDLSLLSPDRFA